MNKFIVLALVAASVALAAGNVIPDGMDSEVSELALNPTDDSETDGLKGTNLEGFRDFCTQTRDTVITDLKSRGNLFTSDVFSSIFKSLGEVAESGLQANNKAAERLSRQLANPEADIQAGDDNVDKIIAEGQEAIKEAGGAGPQGLWAAFFGGIKSFASAGYGTAIKRIMSLKAELGETSITQNLISFCEQLSKYEQQAINIFEETKTNLMAEDQEQYKNVKYSDVAPKCITANRLTRAEGFCKFVLAAKEPLVKSFNFKLLG